MLNKIWYMALILGGVGFVAGLALAGVNSVTEPVIKERILKENIQPTLDKMFPKIGVDNDYIKESIEIELGKDPRGRIQRLPVFKGKKGGQLIAAALQTSEAGFGDNIEVLTVLDLSAKKILGVKTLAQKETVGLGARVADDKEPFIQQFTGMDYSGGIALKSDGGQVDAISGATVSSTAFTAAVNKALKLLEERANDIQAN